MSARRFSFLLLCAAAACSPARAGIRVEASAEPQRVAVGDPIRLVLTVHASADLRVTAPEAPSFAPFEVRAAAAPQRTSAGPGDVRHRFAYELAVFEVGIATIPSIAVPYAATDGGTRTIATPEIPIVVDSLLKENNNGLRGLKGPIGDRRWWLWALIASAIGLAAWIFYLKRRTSVVASAPSAPARPPHETALEELQALASLINGPAKPFYSRLSDVLRTYIEGRYSLPAMDRTTAEIFQEARKRTVAMPQSLKPLFETADLAKFAKWEPLEDAKRSDLERAVAAVEESKPVLIEAER